MSRSGRAHQASREGIAYVPCHLKAKRSLLAMIAGLFHGAVAVAVVLCSTSRAEGRNFRGKSLLDKFSISEIWAREPAETGCVSAETGSNPLKREVEFPHSFRLS